MSGYLLDTNILVVLANSAAPEHPAVDSAVKRLLSTGNSLHVSFQNVVEFWSVATRKGPNGLTMSVQNTSLRVTSYAEDFPVLPDPANLFNVWHSLCILRQIEGPRCYDARLVAFMTIHGLGFVLTTNAKHFSGFPSITVVNPSSLQ